MTDQDNLLAQLKSIRDILEGPTRLDLRAQQAARQVAQDLADRIYFNAGWYAASAANSPILQGSASTASVSPLLKNFAEALAAMVATPKATKKGRKKGSFEPWHYDPGYQVVIAFDESRTGGRSLRERIRSAVSGGWLDKDTTDKTHERRISLIRQRIADQSSGHPYSI